MYSVVYQSIEDLLLVFDFFEVVTKVFELTRNVLDIVEKVGLWWVEDDVFMPIYYEFGLFWLMRLASC